MVNLSDSLSRERTKVTLPEKRRKATISKNTLRINMDIKRAAQIIFCGERWDGKICDKRINPIPEIK